MMTDELRPIHTLKPSACKTSGKRPKDSRNIESSWQSGFRSRYRNGDGLRKGGNLGGGIGTILVAGLANFFV
jgi:hypothetical protein